MKNHTNKYLMCGASNNQATKSRKQREKRKREHTKFVYPVRSQTDLAWGREQSSVPL